MDSGPLVKEQITAGEELLLEYRKSQVALIARRFPPEYFGIPRSKLVDGDSPLARDLVEQNERFPTLIPIRLSGMFGGAWADDIYTYPPEVTAPAEAATRE